MSKTSDAEPSSDDCSSSTTPNSTSTYRYSHEPFKTFGEKVTNLAHQVGAKSIDNIVRLPGGSFNRIIAADLHHHGPSFAVEKVVLRIPRFAEDGNSPNKDILNQCSILGALSTLDTQVPRVLAYDCTSDNALGMPFLLQTRLEGQGLDLVYHEMGMSEKLSIASEFVRILATIEQIKFQNPGRLCCSEAVPLRARVDDIDVSSFSGTPFVQGFGVGIGPPGSKVVTEPTSSLQELLDTQLDAWLQHELSDDRRSFVADMFKRLKAICTQMAELGFFQERASINTNVLYHWDLEPRNMLVETEATSPSTGEPGPSHWQITGVLDWDDALSVPTVLARKPPVWLWDFSDDETLPSSVLAHYDGDVDLLPKELYNETSTRISKEDLQVKQFFETSIVEHLYGDSSLESREAYLDDAYGRGRWLRRLWRFARDGFSDSQHIDRFREFDKAWEKYVETLPNS